MNENLYDVNVGDCVKLKGRAIPRIITGIGRYSLLVVDDAPDSEREHHAAIEDVEWVVYRAVQRSEPVPVSEFDEPHKFIPSP